MRLLVELSSHQRLLQGTFCCPALGLSYRFHISIKSANNYPKDVVPTFTSSIDILFIYFRKYLKLICIRDKSVNDCYTMTSNGIGNDITSEGVSQRLEQGRCELKSIIR